MARGNVADNVGFKRKEYKAVEKRYSLIRDCIGGETVVKSKTTQYLPIPNDGSDDNAKSQRYAAYLLRAVFYGVTKRTIDGFCGQIFMRDPVITLPKELEFVKTDADGAGVSIVQMANKASRSCLAYGRAGLLTDYPTVDGALTKEQEAAGDIRPTMTLYDGTEIINWRTKTRGAREILSLVVLAETYDDDDNDFACTERKQWRVLRLVDDVYTVTVYKNTGTSTAVKGDTVTPKDKDGKTFNEIPFVFIGSENNDSTVDDQPMYDIASMNISHYRNSADYEESVFIVGQPTPVFIGLTEDWVKNVLNGKIYLGSRAAIPLPTGADAKLLQAAPNSLPLEAMQHKEKQMVALGAQVVEKRTVVRTASEAGIDDTKETSVLASIAKNVSAAFTASLVWMTKFNAADATNIKFQLNTDFDIAVMSPEARRQLIEEWQSGALSWEEVRANLRKTGIAHLSDDDAKAAIEKEQAQMMERSIKEAGALHSATGGNNDNTQ